jgi:hypothetical protein
VKILYGYSKGIWLFIYIPKYLNPETGSILDIANGEQA